MKKKRICFRADASSQIGYGHFIRTLALADMLKDNFECVFFTTKPSHYQIEELDKVCRFITLHEEGKFEDFLGCLDGSEIVVLDNYFFTTDYQRKIKTKGCKLVCIDDMHDKHYVADMIINHVLTDKNYFDCEPYTMFCLGLDYALLRAPFLKPLTHNKRNNELVVNFGGSDNLKITDKVVSMLLKLNIPYNIVVILGDKAQLNEENSRLVKIRKKLTGEQMAEVFEHSAAGILSASTVSIEALSRNLPIIIGYYVDNQEKYCHKLAADGRAISVGVLQNLTEDKLNKAICDLPLLKSSWFKSEDIKARYINEFKQLASCK